MFLRFLFQRIRSFPRDCRGNVALLFGLSLLPIVCATGMAVDGAKVASATARAPQALGAAVLVGAARSSGRQARAADHFEAISSPRAVPRRWAGLVRDSR